MNFVPKGTMIAALAPSSAYNDAKFEAGLQILKSYGYAFHIFPKPESPHRYFAGTDEFRAAQIQEAFTNPKYGAVWAIRGGYGLTRILDQLDYDAFTPKPLIGFSDVVALQVPLARRGFPVIHAPVIHSMQQTDEPSRKHLRQLLAGEHTEAMHGEQWISGSIEAPIVGGNLCMLSVLCGTPWQLDTKGKILVLEDIGEYVYRIDRMVQQIKSSGMLNGIAGLVLGEFTQCTPPEGANFDVYDVLHDHLGSLDVPVIAHIPIGHDRANRAFVWNQSATIAGNTLQLQAKYVGLH